MDCGGSIYESGWKERSFPFIPILRAESIEKGICGRVDTRARH